MINCSPHVHLIVVFTISTLLTNPIVGKINWNGKNWAMACDFRGNDLSNVQSPAELCGPKCAQTNECTHFVWNKWNGGTCWMKEGPVSKNDAFASLDRGMVCGVVNEHTTLKPPSTKSKYSLLHQRLILMLLYFCARANQ